MDIPTIDTKPNKIHNITKLNIPITICAIIALSSLLLIGISLLGLKGLGPIQSTPLIACVMFFIIPCLFTSLLVIKIKSTQTIVHPKKTIEDLEKHFQDIRSYCYEYTKRLKTKSKSSFPGLNVTIKPEYKCSEKTKEVLQKLLFCLPEQLSDLLEFQKSNPFNSKCAIEKYKELSNIATAAREFVILLALGIEHKKIQPENLDELITTQKSPLGAILYYSEALYHIFEKEIKPLRDIDLETHQTIIKDLKVLPILEEYTETTTVAPEEVLEIKRQSLKSLRILLLKIDAASNNPIKIQKTWMMNIADNSMINSSKHHYNFAVNTMLSSILYFHSCSYLFPTNISTVEQKLGLY